MLPGLSGGLLPAVQPKQRPIHKLEKKEKGQPPSTLLGLLFEEPELADPARSQSHHLRTDPALPNWWKPAPKSGIRASSCASTAFDEALPCCQSPCKKKAVNRHGEATSTGGSVPRRYSCAVQDARMAVNLLALRAKSKTPSFDLVLA